MATSTQTDRPNTREMVVVHRYFRREFRLAPEMVAGVADGDVGRAAVVGAHLTELRTVLHHHHHGEDELVWPRLTERAELSDDLIERMQEQHGRVAALLHQVEQLQPRWTAGARSEARDLLADALRDVSAALDEHLDEEERAVLPLVEQHMSVAEWDEVGERAVASIAKSRLLVIMGHVLEEADPAERTMMLGVLPPPARVLFKLVGQRKYAREVAVLRAGLTVPRQRRG